MKNTLLTTTALALTSFAGTASAVEVAAGAVNLNIGGFFRTTVAASNAKIGAGSTNAGADYDGVDILTNSEIYFIPSITLDNGIKIGANIQLEGNTTSDQIDESTIFASGDFGRVVFGSQDSAGKGLQVYAPDVSMVYANSTSLTAFVPFGGPTTVPDHANDAERLAYFTPEFGGFKLGVSYARNSSQTSGAVNNNVAGTDYADIGISYNGTVGDVSLGFSARYGTYDRALGANAAIANAFTATTAALTDTIFAGVLTTTAGVLTTTATTATTAATSMPDDTDGITAKADAITAAGVLTSEAATATIAAGVLTSEAATATIAAVTATTAAGDNTVAAAAAAAADPTIAGVGLALGFGAFSIGGGYVEVDEKAGLSKSKTYDIGVSYANGPMGYSLTYVKGKTSGNAAENTSMVAAATYKFNRNFKVGASLASVETDVADGTKGDIKGTIFALSAQFNF